MKLLLVLLLSAFTLSIRCLNAQGAVTPVLDLDLPNFVYTGTFEGALTRVEVEIRRSGVIGFEPDSILGSPVTITIQDKTTVGKVLKSLCAADGKYKIVTGQDPRVVDIVSALPNQTGRLLDTKVPRIDMSLDMWPELWYSQIPEHSAEVRELLVAYDNQQSHPARPAGGAGANMETNEKPPHLELHLKNVTVLEILNALASKNLDRVASENAERSRNGHGLFFPVFAIGWTFVLPETNDLWLEPWLNSVFQSFPRSKPVQ